jgi:hypothetical protein
MRYEEEDQQRRLKFGKQMGWQRVNLFFSFA